MVSATGSPRSKTKVSLRPKEYMGVLFLLCGDRSNQIRKVRGHARSKGPGAHRSTPSAENTR